MTVFVNKNQPPPLIVRILRQLNFVATLVNKRALPRKSFLY